MVRLYLEKWEKNKYVKSYCHGDVSSTISWAIWGNLGWPLAAAAQVIVNRILQPRKGNEAATVATGATRRLDAFQAKHQHKW